MVTVFFRLKSAKSETTYCVKKSEMFSRNEVDMRAGKIREIRVIRLIRDSDKKVLE